MHGLEKGFCLNKLRVKQNLIICRLNGPTAVARGGNNKSYFLKSDQNKTCPGASEMIEDRTLLVPQTPFFIFYLF